MMRYGSVCSGIEAATVAWHPLGWRASFVSEIEAFPRAVLQHRWPEIPLHGDFTTIQAGDYQPIDLLVGGTPCQSFSVAGLRGGLDDERGNLALEYLRLADRLRPRWLVWENVPGVLSSNNGRDFGSILGGLVELGYGFAYRVLDAQFFGVAQRRRRVFVVGHLGDWRRAAAVLFERHGLQGHPAPRREAGERVAGTFSAGAHPGGYNGQDAYNDLLIAHTLKGEGLDASEDGTGRGTPIVPVSFPWQMGGSMQMPHDHDLCGSLIKNQTHAVAYGFKAGQGAKAKGMGWAEELAPTLSAGESGTQRSPGLLRGSAVRRLTPRECERLQGFPEVENTLRILVCKSEDEKRARAKSAEGSSQLLAPGQSAPVAAHVLIDFERQHLQIHSLGRSPWSASVAELANSSRLSMPADAFARVAALTNSIVERAIQTGETGPRRNTSGSTPAASGSLLALLCGREIDALASDAERFTDALSRCSTFITSRPGPNTPTFASILETSACCVAVAMTGFIPEAIRSACSYELRLTVHQGYTLIPWRKGMASDGPRYKALGNSMAVPVMRWIGERIEAVEALADVEAAA